MIGLGGCFFVCLCCCCGRKGEEEREKGVGEGGRVGVVVGGVCWGVLRH